MPRELRNDEAAAVPGAFAAAARRAVAAGIDVIELHASHGYLLHQFLSPLSNHRTDEYGVTSEGRSRLLLDTLQAIRSVCPESMPVFVRIAVSDEAPGGLVLSDGVAVCRALQDRGADAFVPTAGRITADAEAVADAARYARDIREQTSAITVLTGGITSAQDASRAIEDGVCDAVAVGRMLLDNPYWARSAMQATSFEN